MQMQSRAWRMAHDMSLTWAHGHLMPCHTYAPAGLACLAGLPQRHVTCESCAMCVLVAFEARSVPAPALHAT